MDSESHDQFTNISGLTIQTKRDIGPNASINKTTMRSGHTNQEGYTRVSTKKQCVLAIQTKRDRGTCLKALPHDIVNDARADAIFATLKAIVDDEKSTISSTISLRVAWS